MKENYFARGLCTYNQAVLFAKQLDKHGYKVAAIIGTTPEEKQRALTEDWERNGVFLYPWDEHGGPQSFNDNFLYQIRLANNCCPGAYGLFINMFDPAKQVPLENVWLQIDSAIKQAMKDQGID